MTRRSGSNQRQRGCVLTARFNAQEAAAIRQKAEHSGCSIGALIRHALLEAPPPRTVRRPSVDHRAVAQLLGQIGKIGSNVNQLAYHANVGRYRDPAVEAALHSVAEMRLACLKALGYEPDRPEPEELDIP